MSKVVALRPDRAATNEVAATDVADPIFTLPKHKQEKAFRLYRLLVPVLDKVKEGTAAKAACKLFLRRLEAGKANAEIEALAQEFGRKGKTPSLATFERWVARYLEDGVYGLASKKAGRDRTNWGWEVRAKHLWLTEQRRNAGDIAWELQGEGYDSALYHRVKRYLDSLPAMLGENSPRRVGRHHYNQNIGAYITRDESVLPVGFVYQGDGHLLKWYTAHHNSGNHVRYEFTPWIDVRSKFVAGWYLSEAESARSTLFGISKALLNHNHVPAVVHTDPGPGFHNRLVAANEEVGFFGRLSIEHMVARPGNAKGKAIERFFRTFVSRCGKQFDTFCGGDAGPDSLNRMSARIDKGEVHLPSYEETHAAIEQYINRYNNTYQEKLGCTPAEMWARLKRTEIITEAAALYRPREKRSVRRCQIELHNRIYKNRKGLQDYNDGRYVIVEYDLHDASQVWIYDDRSRFICTAQLVHAQPWLAESRLADLEEKRRKGRIKRLDQKKAEIEAQGRAPIDHHAQVDAIESLHQQPSGLVLDMENPLDRQAQEIELDTFDTDY